MQPCCPHCGARLPIIIDAFCLECRRPLDDPVDHVCNAGFHNGNRYAANESEGILIPDEPSEKAKSQSHRENAARTRTPSYLKLIPEYDPTPHVPQQAINKYTPMIVKRCVQYQESPLFVPGEDDNWLRYDPQSRLNRFRSELRRTAFVALSMLIAVLIFAISSAIFITLHAIAMKSDDRATEMVCYARWPAHLLGMAIAAATVRKAAWHARNRLDYRRAIVFLRSHADDGVGAGKGLIMDKASFSRKNGKVISTEEILHEALQQIGPTCSLTAPSGDDGGVLTRPDSYFYRYSVHVTDWQRTVLQWACKARLVVMVLPSEQSLSTEKTGTGWELDVLKKIGRPEKVMMVVPPYADTVIASRWKALREFGDQIGMSFPEPIPTPGDLIIFDTRWNGTIVHHVDGRTVRGFRANVLRTVVGASIIWRRIRRGLIVGFGAFGLFAALLYGITPAHEPLGTALVCFGVASALLGLASSFARSSI